MTSAVYSEDLSCPDAAAWQLLRNSARLLLWSGPHAIRLHACGEDRQFTDKHGILQIADPTFFMKTLPLMDDGDDIAMVLSPQCFHNVHHQADIFNHTNIHFWEYMQIGYDALSFISCTGARGSYSRL